MSIAYYNECDPFAAAWLRELIADGLIAPGWVDERSIRDVQPEDLKGFTQCHFFAGIAVWSLALRIAGWPDDRPVWTGSAPCQPFSAAGKGKGFDDDRHLWPTWFNLIARGKRRDVPVLGEQVASKDGRTWFDLVSGDMQTLGHACGAVDTSAASLGAPFIGQRLYWVGATSGARSQGLAGYGDSRGEPGRIGASQAGSIAAPGDLGRLATSDGGERDGRSDATRGNDCGRQDTGRAQGDGRSAVCDGSSRLAPTLRAGRPEGWPESGDGSLAGCSGYDAAPKPEHGRRIPLHPVEYWRDADWLLCRDPNGTRFRPVEPGTFPLVDARAVRNRLAAVRGAGNALNVSQAVCFIEAVMEYLDS